MSDDVDLESTTLTQRLVLLGVIHRGRVDDAPVHSAEVVRECVDRLEEIDADMVGSVSEADVIRALNRLSADGLLSEQIVDASPSGKGRPTYALSVDETTVLDAFADDHRIDEVVTYVRDAGPG
jgi:DNA-binding HxlR family transcriptional regulator